MRTSPILSLTRGFLLPVLMYTYSTLLQCVERDVKPYCPYAIMQWSAMKRSEGRRATWMRTHGVEQTDLSVNALTAGGLMDRSRVHPAYNAIVTTTSWCLSYASCMKRYARQSSADNRRSHRRFCTVIKQLIKSAVLCHCYSPENVSVLFSQ